MKFSKPFWLALIEKLIACLLLAMFLFPLLLIALLINQTAGSPIFVTDELPRFNGAIASRLRFRTTGCGSRFFPVMCNFLQTYSLNELPGLWSVARGDISLGDLFGLR